MRLSIRFILISDAVVSFQVLTISPRLKPSIPEVKILQCLTGLPVSSMLLGYLVDGLMDKTWYLVEEVFNYFADVIF